MDPGIFADPDPDFKNTDSDSSVFDLIYLKSTNENWHKNCNIFLTNLWGQHMFFDKVLKKPGQKRTVLRVLNIYIFFYLYVYLQF